MISRILKALLAAVLTWISGWALTAVSWMIWTVLIAGFVALIQRNQTPVDKYGPFLWAGFPAMCTGFGLAIGSALRNRKKVVVSHASSFGALGTFVLLAQSICYAPCLMQETALMLVSEFLLFPILCAGYVGFAVYQSLGSLSNLDTRIV